MGLEASVEASGSTSSYASKELRLLPRASMWFHLHPRTSTSSHELRRASTPSTSFHALPRTSQNLHVILLPSMTKGKPIEACTERRKLEASTEGIKCEASTEGSVSNGNFHCSTESPQWAVFASTTGLYTFLCICSCFSTDLNEICCTSTC